MGSQTNDKVVDLRLFALERLSATLDGEMLEKLDQSHIDSLKAQQHDWEIYHLIGDVMRTADLAIKPSPKLAHHIAQKIALEPSWSQPQISQPDQPNKPFRWLQYWPTVAMAAAVASVVWVAKPVIEQMRAPNESGQFASGGTPAMTATARLNSYVSAHRGLSGPSIVQMPAGASGAGR